MSFTEKMDIDAGDQPPHHDPVTARLAGADGPAGPGPGGRLTRSNRVGLLALNEGPPSVR